MSEPQLHWSIHEHPAELPVCGLVRDASLGLVPLSLHGSGTFGGLKDTSATSAVLRL